MSRAGKGKVNRREFLRDAGLAAVAAALPLGRPSVGEKKPCPRARAVLVRDRDALNRDGSPNARVIQRMLDEAVMALTGEHSPKRAWAHFVGPQDVVGIKTNVWAYLPTPKEVERAIAHRVLEAGVPKENLSIDDRGVRHNPVFRRATALFNARPLRTHYWAGIGGCLKNYIMFVPEPSAYHPDECADLGAIWKSQNLRKRTRLNVLVALTPLFYGRGPHHFNRRYVWPYRGLFVGTDPVALDALGAKLLEAKRIEYFGEDRPLDTTPKHVILADTRHGIGCADLRRIELIRLGWMDEALI